MTLIEVCLFLESCRGGGKIILQQRGESTNKKDCNVFYIKKRVGGGLECLERTSQDTGSKIVKHIFDTIGVGGAGDMDEEFPF